MPKNAKKQPLSLEEKSILLRLFGEGELCPSSEYTKHGNVFADHIFQALKKRTNYIDRSIITGSMEKRTALGDSTGPDFDLVIFCNRKPPLNDVVQEFVSILKELPGVKVLRINQFMVSISWCNYEYDVCPASNLIHTSSASNTCTIQRESVYQRIMNSPDPQHVSNELSTGLAESAVQFLRTQSSFTHSVVRVAKYWNSLQPIAHFSGRTLLIETIAVQAALLYEENMYLAVRAFLRLMLRFKTINCDPVKRGRKKKKNVGVSRVVGKPFVLDPANPWNNLAEHVSSESQRALRDGALRSLQRLNFLGRKEMSFVFGPWESETRKMHK